MQGLFQVCSIVIILIFLLFYTAYILGHNINDPPIPQVYCIILTVT